MAALFEDHPFWDFSLAVYGASGVSEACIALQERHLLDVNMLLFCAWNGASGRGALGDDEIRNALAAARSWNEQVVCGLRAVRRWIKDSRTGVEPALADSLRRRIVAVEIDCEHAEQLALARAVTRAPSPDPLAVEGRARAVAENFAAYFRALAIRPGAQDLPQLQCIAAAALPEASGPQIAAALASLAG